MEKVKAIAGAGSWSDAVPTPAAPAAPPVPPAAPDARPAPSTWTTAAPTAPSAPTPPPAPARPRTVASMLDELVASVSGVRGVILASVDGFGLGRSSSMANEAAHPAMLAAAVGLAHQLVAMGGGTELRQLLVDHDGGLLLVWPIGAERVLAVLADTSVDQRGVRAFVQQRTSELVEVPA